MIHLDHNAGPEDHNAGPVTYPPPPAVGAQNSGHMTGVIVFGQLAIVLLAVVGLASGNLISVMLLAFAAAAAYLNYHALYALHNGLLPWFGFRGLVFLANASAVTCVGVIAGVAFFLWGVVS